VAWVQLYKDWIRHSQEGKEFWACPYYVWNDENSQYFRHWVYYAPSLSHPGLNTKDYFYFKDADSVAYWCRYKRDESTLFRWSYLSPSNYCDAIALLFDDCFPAPELARSLSFAGAVIPHGQPIDLAFVQSPPPEPPDEKDAGTEKFSGVV
jgi:hypothetical protein